MALTFSRRAALLQLASIPITLSLARSLRAQTAGGAAPKRLVIFMQNNGTKRCNFWPTPPTPAAPVYPLTNTPILNSLFTNDGTTDNGLKAKTNIIRGMNVTNNVSTTGNQHDVGFARMFTGAQLMPTPDGAPWGGAASIDQILAKDWNVQSLTTAVYASEVEDHPKKGFDHRASFSYVAPQKLNLPVIDPSDGVREYVPSDGECGGHAAPDAPKERPRLRDAATFRSCREGWGRTTTTSSTFISRRSATPRPSSPISWRTTARARLQRRPRTTRAWPLDSRTTRSTSRRTYPR